MNRDHAASTNEPVCPFRGVPHLIRGCWNLKRGGVTVDPSTLGRKLGAAVRWSVRLSLTRMEPNIQVLPDKRR